MVEYEQLIPPVREYFATRPKAINSSSNAVFLESILLHFCALGVTKDRILIAALGAARSGRKSGEANGTLPLDFVKRRVNNHHPGRHQAKVSRVVATPLATGNGAASNLRFLGISDQMAKTIGIQGVSVKSERLFSQRIKSKQLALFKVG